MPEVVVIGQRPPEEDEAIVWPEWDTVEELQPFYSYGQWQSYWSEQDAATPSNSLETAIDDVVRCMKHSAASPVVIHREAVNINYATIAEEGAGGGYTCEANYLEIDKDEIKEYAPLLSTSYMNLFAVTLIHEYIHAAHAARFGCPPWDNADYGPNNEAEDEAYTFQQANDRYSLQFGVPSPLDPRYVPALHRNISCPG